MALSYFTGEQILPFIIGLITVSTAIIAFQFNKKNTALAILFLYAITVGYFVATLDPFLHLWDEQFHALVGKNMIKTPFFPTLYSEPVLDYDYQNWTQNHLWLHKQPLFLWQIALSLKVFGISEIAVRIPSILMIAFASLMVYRIGKIAHSSNVGFYGAVFFASTNYILESATGIHSTDHNDVAFLFYVTASFWAWFEYQNKKSMYWLIAIGVFSGCAILVKWLVGLLIYAVWFLTLGTENKRDYLKIKTYYPLLFSFGITLLVFVPWQLFILSSYPQEAIHEFQLNSLHFFQAVEGHDGDIWYQFKAIKYIYGSGDLIPYLLLLGLFFLVKNSTSNKYRIAIFSAIVIVYVFFSITATKMISFCLIVAPFGLLSFAALTDKLIQGISSINKLNWLNQIVRFSLIIVLAMFLINLPKTARYHTNKGKINLSKKANLEVMQQIDSISNHLRDGKYVVFSTTKRLESHVPIMFYTNHIAYNFVPTKEQIHKIKQQSYKIAFIGNDSLPEFIMEDNEIIKLK
jgi:4-amino-4-deoxy-L-arabinose transferase-like glycosyltransferase